MMKKAKHLLLTVLLIFIIAYALNFVWESLHYSLYNCKWPLNSCAIVTSFRDALIILGVFFGGSFLFRDTSWTFSLTKRKVAVLAMASFLIAYVIELQGLYFGKWTYNSLMPIIPFLNVGLSPILQMILLPFITFWITNMFIKKFYRRHHYHE